MAVAVSFIGTGIMGGSMAGHLLAAGHPVHVHSRTRGKAEPLLARGAAIRFLLTRSYDWLNRPPNALVQPHNPFDYVRRLRFHQTVRSIAAYGLGEAA